MLKKFLGIVCCILFHYTICSCGDLLCQRHSIVSLNNHIKHLEDVAQLWAEGVADQRPHKQNEHQDKSRVLSIKERIEYLQQDVQGDDSFCLIALHNEEVVGMVRLLKCFVTNPNIAPKIASHPEWNPWICALIVKRVWRRQGIGSQLLQAIENKAKEKGFEKVYLCADAKLQTMYKKCNYQIFGDDMFVDTPVDLYEKTLK